MASDGSASACASGPRPSPPGGRSIAPSAPRADSSASARAWGVAAAFLAFYLALALFGGGAMEKCLGTLRERPGRTVLATKHSSGLSHGVSAGENSTGPSPTPRLVS